MAVAHLNLSFCLDAAYLQGDRICVEFYQRTMATLAKIHSLLSIVAPSSIILSRSVTFLAILLQMKRSFAIPKRITKFHNCLSATIRMLSSCEQIFICRFCMKYSAVVFTSTISSFIRWWKVRAEMFRSESHYNASIPTLSFQYLIPKVDEPCSVMPRDTLKVKSW